MTTGNSSAGIPRGGINDEGNSFKKLAHYVKANYFIPDARKFWVKPSVKYLKKYLSENEIDVVITTGPPHSLHLIGLKLKKETGVKWMADFRDPWTEIDYFHQLPLSNQAIKKHHYLEAEVLKNADAVLVVGNTMKSKYDKFNSNVLTITNGFDGEIVDSRIELDAKFTITHIGLMNADRNSKMLWEVLAEICNENETFRSDFQLKLIGKIDASVLNEISKHELSENVEIVNYVAHNEVVEFQKKSQVLLLVVNNVPSAKGIVTGKIFEYLMAKRPILAIAPADGDLAGIIKQTNAGYVVDFNDGVLLKKTILDLYLKFSNNNLVVASENIEQFNRKQLTAKVAEIINKITR